MSRLIPAWALTLGHDDSIAIPLLLKNLVADKRGLCKRLGIDCESEWWPCQGYMCQSLLCESRLCFRNRVLFSALGVQVLNTKDDMKSIAETTFEDMYQGLIRNLPGALPPHSISRDDPEVQHAWRTAALDLLQLEALIVRYYIQYNRFHCLKNYPMTDAMKAHVKPIPLDLWNWGILNYGAPRPVSFDAVRISLS